MEFEGQYLTYEEYQALGGDLPEMPFNLLELEARNQINLRTHNRLIEETTIPLKVKICDFNLINKINSYAKEMSANKNIASESTDGYSISYITSDRIKEVVISKNAELEDIMVTDLYGIIVNNEHIIYNGGIE